MTTDKFVIMFSAVKELVRMLELTPDFREEWESVINLSSTAYPINVCAMFTVYSHFISSRLIAKDLEGMEAVFNYIEEALTVYENDVSNSAGACFLENLVNQTPTRIDPEVWVPLLGPRSRENCRGWDKWTGVQTPGLWNTRMSAPSAPSAPSASAASSASVAPSDPGEARWPLVHLRGWRQYRGFRQAELAERSGVTLSTIAELEVDDPYPDWDHSAGSLTVRKLAEALSITWYQLLDSSPS